MGLSKNEEKYILGLIEGKTQRQAYLAAFPQSRKWKPETVDSKACALFNTDKMKTRYQEIRDRLVKELENEAIVTAKDVLMGLTEVKDVCLAHREAPVVLGGQITKEKVFNAAGANKALELLGKHLGMFDKHDFSEEVEGSGILILPEVEDNA